MKEKVLKLMVLGCAFFLASILGAEGQGKVLMLLRVGDQGLIDLMLAKEVTVMKTALSASGFTMVIATTTGDAIKGSTTSLRPDAKVASIRLADYKGLILPCMAAGGTPIPSEFVAFVKQAAALGKPIAAQNNAVEILGQAGVLKGKRFAIEQDLSATVPGGTFAGIGVVQDGNIVTSGTCPFMAQELSKPDGTGELTRKLIALMR